MVQIVSVAIAIFGIIYGVAKDYQNGTIKIPYTSQTSQTTETAQPPRFMYQYCLMCYDPNIEKVYYQHADGSWRDYPPQQQKIPVYN